MIINLDETMKSFNGEPVEKMGANGPEGNLKIRDLFIDILLKSHLTEERLHASDKLKRFETARKIFHAAPEYEMSFDEMAVIRQCMIDKNFPVMVVGTITEMFDGGGKDAS